MDAKISIGTAIGCAFLLGDYSVEPDRNWAGMYRVRMPGGYLTDMVNLTRAKDAAISLALSALNNAKPEKEAA